MSHNTVCMSSNSMAESSISDSGEVMTVAKSEGSVSSPISEKHIEIPQLSGHEFWLCVSTFILLGVTQLLIWNLVINCFVSFETTFWPGELFSDILGGCEHGAALLVSIAMLKFDGLNIKGLHIVGGINTILYFFVPLVPQFVGEENEVMAKGLLGVICTMMGVCVGFLHVYAYAFASIFSRQFAGYVSFGNGVSGVYSWVIYTIFYECVFDSSKTDQKKLIWTTFGFGAAASLAQCFCFWKLSRLEITKIGIQTHQKNRKSHEVIILERRSLWAIFKDCVLPSFTASFALFLTLNIFPMIGPFSWGLSSSWTNGLMGTFQIGDLIARYIPNLGGWTVLPVWVNFGFSLARAALFIPLFMLPAYGVGSDFLGKAGWLCFVMVAFVLTNGWVVTSGSISAYNSVENPDEKELAMEIFVIMLLAFITVGIFFGKVYLLGL